MAPLSKPKVHRFLTRSDNATTAGGKGRALEDMICYVFGAIPGVQITHRNTLDAFRSEEIDIALWNEKHPRGLRHFHHIILVECKNWSTAVGSSEVGWFESKLRSRGLPFGILVASNGITGNALERTNAHSVIADALSDGRQIIVMTRAEIQDLTSTDGLVKLIKRKLCELAVARTVFV